MCHNLERLLVGAVGTVFGTIFLCACDAAPTVEIAGTAIQAAVGVTRVNLKIYNGMRMRITNVGVSVTCNFGTAPVTVVAKTLCDRKEERRMLNRMTGGYETRSWTVCDPLLPGQTFHTQVSVPGTFDVSACTAKLTGYTDYRTLTQ